MQKILIYYLSICERKAFPSLLGHNPRRRADKKKRGVAQPGSASALGAECRRFKSSRPDQYMVALLIDFCGDFAVLPLLTRRIKGKNRRKPRRLSREPSTDRRPLRGIRRQPRSLEPHASCWNASGTRGLCQGSVLPERPSPGACHSRLQPDNRPSHTEQTPFPWTREGVFPL